MKEDIRKSKRRRWILSILLIVALLCPNMMNVTAPTFATDISDSTDIEIKDFTLTNQSGEIPPGGFYSYDRFYINILWSAKNRNNSIHEGDYFMITLPEAFRFRKNHSACNFDILTPDKTTTVARALVTPGPGDKGGTVKVTFTDYVEGRYDIMGDIKLQANLNTSVVPHYGEVEFKISISSRVKTVKTDIKRPEPIQDEAFHKWGGGDNEDKANWTLRINHKKANLTGVIITDRLETDDGNLDGIEYIPESFKLSEVEMDDIGRVYNNISTIDLASSPKFELAPDKKSFKYDFGDINGKQYMLRYQSTYRSGMVLKNHATLESHAKKYERRSSFSLQSSEGHGLGHLTGKLKIIKIDDSSVPKKIKGAKFLITSVADNKTFTRESDDNGEIFLDRLLPGEYKIKELEVPAGYILDNTEYTVTVVEGNVAVKTITNKRRPPGGGSSKPEKTKVAIKKRWDGKERDSIKVHLYADGKLIASKEITKAMGWTYEFTDLDKYNGGKQIKYTIKEDPLDGYSSIIEGNADDGYIIINKATPPPDREIKHEDEKPGEDPTDTTPEAKPLPKTGDGLNPSDYGIMFVVAGFILLVVGILRYRHGKKI